MKITMASTLANDPNVTIVSIATTPWEVIRKGEIVTLPLRDGGRIETEVTSLKYNGPRGKKEPEYIDGDSCGEIAVEGVPSNLIRTVNDPPKDPRAKRTCLTPYKELRGGEQSIHDFVREGYTVPRKVIKYLKTSIPFIMSPGVYNHPFRPGQRLLGPYWNTDKKYYWDRDTWKYVVKYHLTLPQEFIDHVMSFRGTVFLMRARLCNSSWNRAIQQMKKQPNTICLFPDDGGDVNLDEF